MQSRDEIIRQLKFHLLHAQQLMKKQADKTRRDIEFAIADCVFLKMRFYRQTSLVGRSCAKLAVRYFGTFEIISRVWLAYKLKLPVSYRIHPIFHISQLKKVIGEHQVVQDFPAHLDVSKERTVEPERNYRKRNIICNNQTVSQVLVQWKGSLWRKLLGLIKSTFRDNFLILEGWIKRRQ